MDATVLTQELYEQRIQELLKDEKLKKIGIKKILLGTTTYNYPIHMIQIGKGNKERTVYLNKACINAINEYLEYRPEVESGPDKYALFLSERKKRISNRMVQTTIKDYLKSCGLGSYSTHKLRHTAATLMYQNGVDVRALQEILGHENIGTTEIYTHVDNYQIRQAVENNPLADY